MPVRVRCLTLDKQSLISRFRISNFIILYNLNFLTAIVGRVLRNFIAVRKIAKQSSILKSSSWLITIKPIYCNSFAASGKSAICFWRSSSCICVKTSFYKNDTLRVGPLDTYTDFTLSQIDFNVSKPSNAINSLGLTAYQISDLVLPSSLN